MSSWSRISPFLRIDHGSLPSWPGSPGLGDGTSILLQATEWPGQILFGQAVGHPSLPTEFSPETLLWQTISTPSSGLGVGPNGKSR